MYILFAVLVSLAVYGAVVALWRLTGRATDSVWRSGAASLLVLGAALALFTVVSRVAGVDVGPGHTVSYNIPGDYLARGAPGVLALLLYLVACLSSAVALTVLRTRQRLA